VRRSRLRRHWEVFCGRKCWRASQDRRELVHIDLSRKQLAEVRNQALREGRSLSRLLTDIALIYLRYHQRHSGRR
jgi:hypothetical protein